MLRVTPRVFHFVLTLIENHPVFQNSSNVPQMPVEQQLAVTFYRLGHYGNAASIKSVARMAGIGEGTVELFTRCCLTAIISLHDIFVRKLTVEEKEVEKEWIDNRLGFKGTWRNGWVMYDGTIIPLHRKPG
jgi:hypothetical protein